MTALRLLAALRRFRREDRGVASLEFVVAVPVFLMIFMASFESAMLMTRFVMLERGVDITVRELRLGGFSNPQHQVLKEAICSHTVMFEDCENTLMLELRTVNTASWQSLDNSADCVDRAPDAPIQPLSDLSVGLENEMMLVRACAVFEPMFPLTGIGLKLPRVREGSSDYGLVATSAFVNEPNT
jgi:hypothetical protein